ncbi:hypothetical protein IEO21_11192 [Rhodonia placenta]|uniref:Uncharacterized protein n=1 Tax=Rhodonia placenta TaxID=104341 RepID=A0A8H7NQU7_9APHY|nr:hypothetical protein IEO21_11192 [Postia placenta]
MSRPTAALAATRHATALSHRRASEVYQETLPP